MGSCQRSIALLLCIFVVRVVRASYNENNVNNGSGTYCLLSGLASIHCSISAVAESDELAGQCTPIAALLDGKVQVQYSSDARVIFSCLHGYVLSGQRDAVCEFGQWNLARLPTCANCELQHIFFTKQQICLSVCFYQIVLSLRT